MRHTILILLMFFALSLPTVPLASGCGALPVVATVLDYATDAVLILDAIDEHANLFFARSPNAELEESYREAALRTRAALVTAQRIHSGVDELSEHEVAIAFAEFREAYEQLLVVAAPLGVRQDAGGGRMSATGDGTLFVPRPKALAVVDAQACGAWPASPADAIT